MRAVVSTMRALYYVPTRAVQNYIQGEISKDRTYGTTPSGSARRSTFCRPCTCCRTCAHRMSTQNARTEVRSTYVPQWSQSVLKSAVALHAPLQHVLPLVHLLPQLCARQAVE